MLPEQDLVMNIVKVKEHTKLSPLSFVIFAGSPLGNACSNISSCPERAASNIRVAKAIASGGRSWEVPFVAIVSDFLDNFLHTSLQR